MFQAVWCRKSSHFKLLRFVVVQALWLVSTAPLGATTRIDTLDRLTPNPKLVPIRRTDCIQLLGPALRPRITQFKPTNEGPIPKTQLLEYVNYLLCRRFPVSSLTLSREPFTVRALLNEKFGLPLSGRRLYQELQRQFSTVEEAVSETPEGQKLANERNDADYKSWSLPILIKLAQDCEKMGIPFDANFIKVNSGLVGMKLSEKYGYPVRGDQILTRADKLGVTIAQIRKEAGLPETSPLLAKIEKLNEIPWSKEYITSILQLLKDRGYQIAQKPLTDKRVEIEALFLKELGVRLPVAELDRRVYEFYGGWPEAKKTIGITYEGRGKEMPGRPDWSNDFVIQVFQFLNNEKFVVSYSSLQDADQYAPLREAIKNKFGFDIRGKTLYEYASERFGTFEAACHAAGIPYRNFNQEQLSTKWVGWDSTVDGEKLNPALVMQILKLIDALGFEPTEALLKDETAYAPLRAEIKKRIGIDVPGDLLRQQAEKYFSSIPRALDAAGVAKAERPVWTDDLRKKALALMREKFGPLTGREMRNEEVSPKIGLFLREKLRIRTSGYELWYETKAIRAAERNEIDEPPDVVLPNGLLARTVNPSGQQRPMDATDPSIGPLDEETLLLILKAIDELGYFPSSTFLRSSEFYEILPELERRFGKLTGEYIAQEAKRLYGDLAEARDAAGLSFRNNKVWDEDFTIQVLKAVMADKPNITERYLVDHAVDIKQLVKEKFKIETYGSMLRNSIEENFGDLAQALAATGTRQPWTRFYHPTKDEVLDVLKYIWSQGFEVTAFSVQSKTHFAPVAAVLKKHYGFDIGGVKLYNHIRRLFKPGGWHEALAEAGVQTFKQPKWTPEFTLDCLRVLLLHFPYLSPTTLTNQHREAVEELLYEEFDIRANGRTIQSYVIEFFGSLDEAFKKLKYKHPWPTGGLPSKTTYIAVLKYIASQGYFPKRNLFQYEDNYKPVKSLLEAHYGLSIRGNAFLRVGKELFGSYNTAYRDAGFTRRKGFANWSPEFALQALSVVADAYPGMNGKTLEKMTQEIRTLLKEKLGQSDVSGHTLLNYVNEYFGSVSEALKKAGKERIWPSYEKATKKNVIDVLQFLHSKGFEFSGKDFGDDEHYARLNAAIEAQYGYSISRISFVKNVDRLFHGFRKAIKAAGIESNKPPVMNSVKTPEQFIEILQYLDSQGFILIPELFNDPEKFAEVAQALKEKYGFKAARNEFYKTGRELFGGYREAIKAAGIALPDDELTWTKELTIEGLKQVLIEFPDANYMKLFNEYNKPAEALFLKKLQIQSTGQTFVEYLKFYFGSFNGALEALHYNTPWMIDGLRSPDITQDQYIDILKALAKRGFVLKAHIIGEYSPQIALILKEDLGITMTGFTLNNKGRDLFSRRVKLAYQKAGLDPKNPPQSLKYSRAQLLKSLELVGQFGFNLTSESLSENSEAVAWINWFKFERLLSGTRLVKQVEDEFGSVEEAVRLLREAPVLSATIAVNDSTFRILKVLLAAAGIDVMSDTAVDENAVQIQRIVNYHFGRTVDLKELKLHRM